MPRRSRADAPTPCRRDSSGLRPGVLMTALALAVPAPALSHDADAALAATADPALIANLDRAVFVDTRDIEACARASIDGALCMAPRELLHPDGTPASFRGLNWLAGTFGLDPAAVAVVFGDDRTDSEFVAGMLFLLGQSRVVIWRGDLHSMPASVKHGTGRRRGILRSLYYASPVRDGYIALDDDARRFFGAGSVSEAAVPAGDADASVWRRDEDGALLVLAGGAREAVAGFARVLLEQPSAPAQVHIDGLRGRTAESLGAPRDGDTRMMTFAVSLGIALVLWAVLASRRRAMARLR